VKNSIFFCAATLLFCSGLLATADAALQLPDSPTSDAASASVEVPEIELLAVGKIASDATDLSKLDPVSKLGRDNMLAGISGIDYSGSDDIYYFLPDKGPQGGASGWRCRVQKIRLTIDLASPLSVKTERLATVMLKDENGNVYTGLPSAFKTTPNQAVRLDPESIRIGPNGNFFISDEYGPRLIEFTSSGEFVRELPVPKKFLIQNPDTSKKAENANNDFGRVGNNGMEGLAISPDGETLFGLMQAPLLQDCGRKNRETKPAGTNCRLLRIKTDGKILDELLYPLDSEDNGTNEILAVDEETFLVIERDGDAGNDAKFKKLMLISTTGASDISQIQSLPRNEIPSQVTPIRKKEFIDLLDSRWNLAGPEMPPKIEGLAFGPRLTDGRRTLIVVSDNDFSSSKPTQIYVFAVSNQALNWGN